MVKIGTAYFSDGNAREAATVCEICKFPIREQPFVVLIESITEVKFLHVECMHKVPDAAA
jgi:hypothetical protein